jgi:glycosyltransferase involved in cell wall biosynthesis
VIGNGFKVDTIHPREIPSNKDINVVFVGSQNLPWHGIDILFEISQKLKYITFHIVGATGNENQSSVNNVIIHPYLDENNLKKLYNIIDIGISSLALFRNEMTDACPLKSREYLSFGIPVIGAYKDPDLSGFDFYLELPNSYQGIMNSIDEIERFIKHWKGKSIDRKVVNQIIGLDNKELKRLEFLKSF